MDSTFERQGEEISVAQHLGAHFDLIPPSFVSVISFVVFTFFGNNFKQNQGSEKSREEKQNRKED